ncbi:hypothetical protein ULMA_02320 [Patiriisocius marinus]|uniref:DUF3127 domain-containing protein n=1 Tax=Patiriisocius marinus TaxID=1397112 RepID=A0A5J4IU08_9FLAO|nr:DUF3127 domain-containing protein [Patiriisocius marinus]GER58124.1 hypothetical protein ULMA_02320 [Patiriisocius marinus]
MTSKLQFIQHISEMNTKSLKEILVKNAFKKYSNNSFLEKLNEIFIKIKASGNTHLEIHKGIGVCTCNKDKKVFCFVGNVTKDYFTLTYLEDENKYYNFQTSCSEILYESNPTLNKFYYFSIKPEETSAYKKHTQISNPIQEYKVFCTKEFCSMETIELWLKKHKNNYKITAELLENKNNRLKLNSVELLVKREFEKLYGSMSILSKIYHKETYFKEQLKEYSSIKDSISKLEKWFYFQEENKNEYQLFSSVFYDNRELTHFSLKLNDLILDPNDFKYTLKYMSIIEDAQAIEFKGTIVSISEIEFIERKYAESYPIQKIVLSINDFCCSEYQITFSKERVKHLDNLSVGQFVKVFARLTGGEYENTEGIKDFKYNLYGWRIEKLDAKPKVKKNTKEMDLYYKYILPPPF